MSLFKNLIDRLLGRKPAPAAPVVDPERMRPRLVATPRPRASASSGGRSPGLRAVPTSRREDDVSDPLHPLNPLNPLNPVSPLSPLNQSSEVWREPVRSEPAATRCDDDSATRSYSSSSWGGDCSSDSGSSYSSSDSGSSSSSSSD